jgi:hypothetical protein
MRRAVIAAVVAAGLSLSACTATVGGTGAVGLPAAAAPTVPNQPGGPASPDRTAPTVACPNVTDPQAGLTYRCVTAGISPASDLLWTLNLTKQVEPGWLLGEGSAAINAPANTPLDRVTELVRGQMVELGYWGPNPGVRTLSSTAATVAGVKAWVLASSFTINAAYRGQQHLKVRAEHTWIVALRTSAAQLALWSVTLPDDVRQLWRTVPALIGSIKLR